MSNFDDMRNAIANRSDASFEIDKMYSWSDFVWGTDMGKLIARNDNLPYRDLFHDRDTPAFAGTFVKIDENTFAKIKLQFGNERSSKSGLHLNFFSKEEVEMQINQEFGDPYDRSTKENDEILARKKEELLNLKMFRDKERQELPGWLKRLIDVYDYDEEQANEIISEHPDWYDIVFEYAMSEQPKNNSIRKALGLKLFDEKYLKQWIDPQNADKTKNMLKKYFDPEFPHMFTRGLEGDERLANPELLQDLVSSIPFDNFELRNGIFRMALEGMDRTPQNMLEMIKECPGIFDTFYRHYNQPDQYGSTRNSEYETLMKNEEFRTGLLEMYADLISRSGEVEATHYYEQSIRRDFINSRGNWKYSFGENTPIGEFMQRRGYKAFEEVESVFKEKEAERGNFYSGLLVDHRFIEELCRDPEMRKAFESYAPSRETALTPEELANIAVQHSNTTGVKVTTGQVVEATTHAKDVKTNEGHYSD